MPRLRCAALRAAVCWVLCCAAAAAQSPLPGDWVAALIVREPLAAAPRVGRLLEHFGVSGLEPSLLDVAADPAFALQGAEVAVGLATADGDAEAMYVFATVPTPAATLAEVLHGDLTGDIAVFSLNGIDFAARERRGATLIVPLTQQAVLLDEPADGANGGAGESAIVVAPVAAHDLTVRLSERGLNLLRDRVERQAGGHDPRRRFAITQLAWPPTKKWVDAAIGGNLPLADRVAELFKSGSIGLTLQADGGVAAELVAVRRGSTGAAIARSEGVAPPAVELPRPPIATLSGSTGDGALRPLVSLFLAYGRGRPDEIEASTYPEVEYAELESHALAAVDLVEGIDASLLARQVNDPFYSNRLIALSTTDAAEFAEHVEAATDAWNRLVKASDARVPVTIKVAQSPAVGGRDRETRFTMDLGAALESPTTEDIKQIMRQYYGASGLHTTRLVALDDRRVVLSDIAEEDLKRVLENATDGADQLPERLSGQVRLDRYANWQNAILNHYMANAIGFTPPTDLDEAPLSLAVDQDPSAWRLELSAPEATLARLAELLKK